MDPNRLTDRRRRHAINVLDDLAHVLDEYEGCFDRETNAALRAAGRALCARLAVLRAVPLSTRPEWSEPQLTLMQ